MGSVTALSNSVQKRWEFAEATLPADWEVISQGASQSLAMGSGVLTLNGGTGANESLILRCKESCSPKVFLRFTAYITQRIANQDIYLELATLDGQTRASFRLTGTNNAVALCEAANNGVLWNPAPSMTIIASSSIAHYDILADIEAVTFANAAGNTGGGRNCSIVDISIPTQDTTLYPQIRIVNGATAPASNTIVYINSVTLEDLISQSVELSFLNGNSLSNAALPVRVSGGVIERVSVNATAISVAVTSLAANASGTYPSMDFTGAFNSLLTGLVSTNVSGTLYIEESYDASNFYVTRQISIPSGGAVIPFEHKVHSRYARLRYVNGAAVQSHFKILVNNFAM